MVKRFHDTEIWKQDWFLDMDIEYRVLWLYVKDNCDHAGMWKPEKKFVEFITGKEIDLVKGLHFFNRQKERVAVLKNGRWFLRDFIVFQYGVKLNTENRVHASIKRLLDTNEVKMTSIRGLIDLTDRVKDKDKDKEGIDVDVEDRVAGKGDIAEWFTKIWERYPPKGKVGKKNALKHFIATVKTKEDADRCTNALAAYINSERVKNNFVMNASTWFNQWEDWENHAEPSQREDSIQRLQPPPEYPEIPESERMTAEEMKAIREKAMGGLNVRAKQIH
jgi:hypothetical protein